MRGSNTKLPENKRAMGIARWFVVLSLFALLAAGISLAADLPSLTRPVVVTQGLLPTHGDRITVDIDFSIINPDQAPVAAMSVSVPDRTITILKDRILQRGTDDYSWFGTVEGQELSTAILTVVDGIIYGNISTMGELYSIEPSAGSYLVKKLDPQGMDSIIDAELMVPHPPPSISPTASITPLADSGTQIDLLVLYTPQMQTAYGSGLAAKIQSLVDYSNQAYTNSVISTQLRLVGTILYSDANAVEGISLNTALDTITNDSSVDTSRNSYYADLVALMRVYYRAEGDGCGLAWVNEDNPLYEMYGFSVVKVGNDGAYFCYDKTLVHELGHNMGCAHNRAIASVFGAYPYSFGYDHQAAGNPPGVTFGTIMSYVNPPIAYFSTPLITYSDVPIGVTGGPSGNDNPTTSADNARTINITRVTVSNYRASADTTPPPAPISLTATPSSWTNINNFSINWTNPSEPSGIAGAWYKIGSAPASDTDGTYTTNKPFNVAATAQGGQTLHVWLQDGLGNKNRASRSSITLNYDGTAPTDGTLTATKGNGAVSLSWTAASDTGGSGLASSNRYIVKRNTGSAPNVQCTNGTQVYLGMGTSATDSSLINGTTYYYRVCVYGTAGNISQGATATATLTVNAQFNSSPTDRDVVVDSVSYTAPWSTIWATASTHTINVDSPQSGGAGIQYVFSSWSDGGAQSHSIAPVADTTYTANFTTQYLVTTDLITDPHGNTAPDCLAGCWYNSGVSLQLTAIPDSGYVVDSWGVDCAGTDLTTTLTLDGPKICSVTFKQCAGPEKAVKLVSTADTYDSIEEAYALAIDHDTIELQATTLTPSGGGLDFSRTVPQEIEITLRGGYGCGYSGPSSLSIISGSVTVSRGTVIMDRIVIK